MSAKWGAKESLWQLAVGAAVVVGAFFTVLFWDARSDAAAVGETGRKAASTTVDGVGNGSGSSVSANASVEIKRLDGSVKAARDELDEISTFVGRVKGAEPLSDRLARLQEDLSSQQNRNWAVVALALLAALFGAWAAYRASTLGRQLADQASEIAKLRKSAAKRDAKRDEGAPMQGYDDRYDPPVATAKGPAAQRAPARSKGASFPGSGSLDDSTDAIFGQAAESLERDRLGAPYAPKWSDEQTFQRLPTAPAPLPQTRIAFGPIRELVQGGAAMIASEFRAKADALGRRIAVGIGADGLRIHLGEDDGLPRPLIAIVDQVGRGVLIPSHDYIKNFSIAHHKVRDPSTGAIEPFFEIAVTNEGSLRYDSPCEIVLDGETVTVRQRGRLSGYSE